MSANPNVHNSDSYSVVLVDNKHKQETQPLTEISAEVLLPDYQTWRVKTHPQPCPYVRKVDSPMICLSRSGTSAWI